MRDTVLTEYAGGEPDHAALRAACEPGTALCTITGIDGAFSRRIGAQLAVRPDGSTVGNLADGCLERMLATDVRSLTVPEVRRYGRGSDKIDFRLPCGGGLDILLDPRPDHCAVRAAVEEIHARRPARLMLPDPSSLARTYLPALRLRLFGKGQELAAVDNLAQAMDIDVETVSIERLSLGHRSTLDPADRWTAILLLFHDHDWELALIEEALDGGAFYIGAQGSERARAHRRTELLSRGVSKDRLARLRSPVGVVPSCKTPRMLALSALTEIISEYEGLRDAA